jgi:hypothetical protein
LSGISDPLAALVVGLFAITLFGLVLYIGAAPPILIHDFAKHGWHFVPGPADLVHVGPVGNLAQIVGAGAAAWMFFRAIVLILAIALVFGILSNHYHF